jgi:hypothetical protein
MMPELWAAFQAMADVAWRVDAARRSLKMPAEVDIKSRGR